MDDAPRQSAWAGAWLRIAALFALALCLARSAPGQDPARATAILSAISELELPTSQLGPPDFAPPELVAPATGTSTLWLIETRHLGCNAPPAALRYAVGNGHGHWIPTSYAEFRASDAPDVPTVVFVHGNRYDRDDARTVGQAMYARLLLQLGPDEPVRFVVWSWPSDHIRHSLKRDVRVKAIRAESEGTNLANFVAALPPGAEVCLIGHSYGARVIGPALHWLAGYDATHADQAAPRRRAVLMAGALDCGWLAPAGKYPAAPAAVERLVVLFNPCDSVLKWYPKLWGRGGPQALGAMGLPASASAAWGDRLVQINIEPLVERRHSLYDYHQTPAIWGLLDEQVRFERDDP